MIKHVIRHIIETNRQYVGEDHAREYRDSLDHQTPEITLVTCADSRISSDTIYRDTINHVFVIRNVGNQFLTAAGSVDYGVRALKTPLLVFLAHSGCGAVAGAIDGCGCDTPALNRELLQLREGLAEMGETYDPDDPHRLDRYIALNLDFQVKTAMDHYADLVASGKLDIFGLVLDVHQCIGDGCGAIYIANINGVRGRKAMASDSMLDDIRRDLVERVLLPFR